jgi:hypothetical protein
MNFISPVGSVPAGFFYFGSKPFLAGAACRDKKARRVRERPDLPKMICPQRHKAHKVLSV